MSLVSKTRAKVNLSAMRVRHWQQQLIHNIYYIYIYMNTLMSSFLIFAVSVAIVVLFRTGRLVSTTNCKLYMTMRRLP